MLLGSIDVHAQLHHKLGFRLLPVVANGGTAAVHVGRLLNVIA